MPTNKRLLPKALRKTSARMAEPTQHIMADGRDVVTVTLEGHGLSAEILSLGATLRDLRLDGHTPPLVLGHEDLSDYAQNPGFLGAIVGRYANRIHKGRVEIDGVAYQLATQDRGNALHGGPDGTFAQNWTITELSETQVTLSVTLPDGHMGYPGALKITATYRLMPDATLDLVISAQTDKTTLCNLAPHSYFNLDGTDDLRDHRLEVFADQIVPVDAFGIPPGHLSPVKDSEFDFRQPRSAQGTDLDINYCFTPPDGLHRNARLTAPNGRSVTVYSNQPGLQVFNAAEMDTEVPGLTGRRNGPFCGIAFEPQIWPDAPNQPGFPDATLRPGETYLSHSRFVFT